MIAYFAYGSNMSRAAMRRRCPKAVAVGRAWLDRWRFALCAAGYATVVPAPGHRVHGVLWRISLRDLAALNAYEAVDSGLYVRRMLPVRCGGALRPALLFVAHRRTPGRPRPGYGPLVAAAARDWQLPTDYVRSLERLAAASWPSGPGRETGEIIR